MAKTYLTAREIAGRLRVSPEAVYRWARQGELPGAVRIGGTLRVELRVLDEFLRRGGELGNPSFQKQNHIQPTNVETDG
jgi:excisionase family DNA binding protein